MLRCSRFVWCVAWCLTAAACEGAVGSGVDAPDGPDAGADRTDARAVHDADPSVTDGGSSDAATADAGPFDAGDPGCTFAPDAPILLTYASVGNEDNPLLLAEACEYQLVVGDKRTAPAGVITSGEVRARGGRSGHVVADHGQQIRRWLREDGIEETAARVRRRLDAGYDYIVIDEITAHPEWADSHEVSHRFRRVLDRIPEATVIAYVSIDLTQYAGGGADLRARRWLMRALQRRGHRIGLEVYLHTGEVVRGEAPAAFRRAATRLSEAVEGLTDAEHIQRSAFTVLGLSLNSTYPQYRYLDWPERDLESVERQVRELRESGALVASQRGLGYYFVNRSDLTPPSTHPYDLYDLLDRMAASARMHFDE